MPWHPSKSAGARGYYASECSVCGATPWYRVGTKGFCRNHYSVAKGLRVATMLIKEFDQAQADTAKSDSDREGRKYLHHHAATGRKFRGRK